MGKALMQAGDLDEAEKAYGLGMVDVRRGRGMGDGGRVG